MRTKGIRVRRLDARGPRVGVRARRALVAAALVATAVAGCAAVTMGPDATVPDPQPGRPGFVTTDGGGGFAVDGVPTTLVGMNIYNAASRGNCWYDMREQFTPALERIREASENRANVVRVWFFQRLATRGEGRDWTELDRVLASAREAGVRVIPVLTDQWGACEGPNGAGGPYKDISWYESGYRELTPEAGPVPYRDWVREVVTRYRDDPTVALWSLVNEAEAATERDGDCPSGAVDALAAFADDMAGVVDEIDPAHLLGLGTIGGGQCGSAGEEYVRLHQPERIDLCEYHDYDVGAMPGDATNGLATRLQQCADLGKPMLMGETGAIASEVGGIEGRAEVFREKMNTQLDAGAAGFLLWGWSNQGFGPDDEYGIGPDDPALGVLAEAPDSALVR